MATNPFAGTGNIGSPTGAVSLTGPQFGVYGLGINWNTNWDILHQLATMGAGTDTDIGASHAYYDRLWAQHPLPKGSPGGPATPTEWLQDNLPGYTDDITLGAIDYAYFNKTGQHLTAAQKQPILNVLQGNPELRGRLSNDILGVVTGNNYDPSAKGTGNVGAYADILTQVSKYGSLGDAMGADVAGAIGLSQGISAPGSVVSQQNLISSKRNSVQSDFYNKLGRMPSSAQIDQMVNMGADALSQYLGSQTYKLGLTLDQYHQASSQMNNLYMQYFGRDATDQEIAWGHGKSQDDITNHVLDSPSRVDGLTVRKFNAYKNALDQVSQQEFGYEAPDEMIKALHDAQQGPQR